jgi:LPXTG-site transpeptidase (sortase) family protein
MGVDIPIVGVPEVDGEWDVTWLGNHAGYLEGTAFPTWVGNSGITAHVWDANNNPGPFAELKKLQHGDEVRIHAWGMIYTYEVRFNYLVTAENMYPLSHQDLDWVTLLTCEVYSESQNAYRYRRIVRAVLVSVE